VIETPFAADERGMLLGYLQRQRDLVVWKVSKLGEQAADSVATPSGLTIRGVLYHLQDVERSWLRRWFAGGHGLRSAALMQVTSPIQRLPKAFLWLISLPAIQRRHADAIRSSPRTRSTMSRRMVLAHCAGFSTI
jgi:hypothetical protein